MIRSFVSNGTRDVFDGADTKQARRICPAELFARARRRLYQLNQAAALGDLSAPPGNLLELLIGARFGQNSIRINEQYRICFRWTVSGPEDVEIVDHHD